MSAESRVAAAIAEHARRRAAQAKRREAQAQARRHGLAKRHARKLRLLARRDTLSVTEPDGTPERNRPMTDPDALTPEQLHAARQAEINALFAEFAALPVVDLEQLEHWLNRIGRVHGPALLFDAWYADQIDDDTLTSVIGRVWSMSEYPNQNLDPVTWRELFHAAGFTIDGQPAKRPTEPLELWRGSVPERRTDWSWTTDRTVAERYAAGGIHARPAGRLYRVVAPPDALLCANTERDEAEYVVDTAGLEIEEQEPPPDAA